MLTAEARRFWKNLRDATIAEGGSASPEDDVNLPPKAEISDCEGVRVNCRTNALSVKLRGSHAA
jgi:hypothetical protein